MYIFLYRIDIVDCHTRCIMEAAVVGCKRNKLVSLSSPLDSTLIISSIIEMKIYIGSGLGPASCFGNVFYYSFAFFDWVLSFCHFSCKGSKQPCTLYIVLLFPHADFLSTIPLILFWWSPFFDLVVYLYKGGKVGKR